MLLKIAQLTFNVYDNYGNMLQKYALHRVLKRYADQCDVLWHSEDKFLPETWEWNWRPQLIKMFNSANERRKFVFEAIRQTKFKEFADRHIRTRFGIRALDDLADEYDFFVVGSDQVWNPDFSEQFFPGRFLTFAAPEKRIAYAASIALKQLSEQIKPIWRAGILGMAHVSVREKTSVPIIEELTGVAPRVLIDPVFLLTAEEWSEVAIRPAWLNDRYENGYMLAYFLSAHPNLDLKRIAAELGLPLINLLDSEVFNHYNVGPSEFLWLIQHASLIYTDSFHGTSFSILNARPFITCDYVENGRVSVRMSRIFSLLEDFNLMARKPDIRSGYRLERPFDIDYADRDRVLARERAKAEDFLNAALLKHRGGNENSTISVFPSGLPVDRFGDFERSAA